MAVIVVARLVMVPAVLGVDVVVPPGLRYEILPVVGSQIHFQVWLSLVLQSTRPVVELTIAVSFA